LELAKSKKVREETEDRCAEELGQMIQRVEGEAEIERKAREDSHQRMYE
jgi:hypothetical protein